MTETGIFKVIFFMSKAIHGTRIRAQSFEIVMILSFFFFFFPAFTVRLLTYLKISILTQVQK